MIFLLTLKDVDNIDLVVDGAMPRIELEFQCEFSLFPEFAYAESSGFANFVADEIALVLAPIAGIAPEEAVRRFADKWQFQRWVDYRISALSGGLAKTPSTRSFRRVAAAHAGASDPVRLSAPW